MPERKKLLLWLIAMMLIFLLLLVIIWLVYSYRMRQLDQQLKPPSLSWQLDIDTKATSYNPQTSRI